LFSDLILEAFVQKLKEKLKEKLPGPDAQYLMAPLHRARVETEILKVSDYKASAVMIVFCEDKEGRVFIPLTERMSYNGAHSGQISLPGGKYDPADGDLENTAVRECFEEIGITDLEVIGKLTELFIPVSGFLVHPYVAFCTSKDPAMSIQEREVKSILKLDLETLLNEKTIESGSIEVMNNLRVNAPWYKVDQFQVWGATAMILSELKELMKTIS
jgi:8-oxo-dGTP pyrophosphatase MutT (NUDIX family)